MDTIQLDPRDVVAESQTTLTTGGVPVILSLSPFDVPRSVTVDRDASRLRLTFQYVDNEEPVIETVRPDFIVSLGKNSRKVLAVEIKGTAGSAWDIRVRIVEGVDAQLRRATKDNQRLNYRAIRNVVQSKKLEPLLAR